MRYELEDQLKKDFPKLFEGPMYLEICDGWYNILRDLCEELARTPHPPRFTPIKEKFGVMRVYVDRYDDHIYAAINKADHKSATVCEMCGNAGEIRNTSWVKVLCDVCLPMYENGHRWF